MTTRNTARKSEKDTITERVVKISRITKVVKGGRHLRFSAVVVVGDGEGSVGIGRGKAEVVPDAVKKGATNARKTLTRIPLKGSTIPHEITAKFDNGILNVSIPKKEVDIPKAKKVKIL